MRSVLKTEIKARATSAPIPIAMYMVLVRVATALLYQPPPGAHRGQGLGIVGRTGNQRKPIIATKTIIQQNRMTAIFQPS